MTEKLGLTHKEAVILLDAVFAPFMQRWQSDSRLAPLITDKKRYYHFLAEMAHTLGALLHGAGDPLTHIRTLCQEAQDVGLPLAAVEDYAHQFLEAFEQWVAQADDAMLHDGRDVVLARVAQLKREQLHCVDDQSAFVMADSEHMDAAIDSMHNISAGREAISAQAFLAEGYLDEDIIERIVDDINTLTSELYFYGDFDEGYAQFVINHLEEFSLALDATMEFDDLSWAVRQFIHVLKNLPKQLDPALAQSIKQLTDQVVEDLAGWVNHVLVDQDAQDIHYLDAALMASVKQIALMLGVPLEERETVPPSAPPAQAAGEADEDDFIVF